MRALRDRADEEQQQHDASALEGGAWSSASRAVLLSVGNVRSPGLLSNQVSIESRGEAEVLFL